MWFFKRLSKKSAGEIDQTPALSEEELSKIRFKRRIGAIILVLVALILLVFAVRLAYRKLTLENPRFTFGSVKVSGGEFYEKNPEVLAAESGVNQLLDMKVNLFRINLAAVQSRIEQLPKVNSCIVHYELPDTLHLEISERIPRAQIKQANESKNSRGTYALVADESGFLFPANRCSDELVRDLPVIGNLKNQAALTSGSKVDELESAMQLLMLTLRNFGEIKVRVVDMSDPDDLKIWMDYGWFASQGNLICVVMSSDTKSMPLRLTALHSELYRNYPSPETRKKWRYKLSYDGQITIQPIK